MHLADEAEAAAAAARCVLVRGILRPIAHGAVIQECVAGAVGAADADDPAYGGLLRPLVGGDDGGGGDGGDGNGGAARPPPTFKCVCECFGRTLTPEDQLARFEHLRPVLTRFGGRVRMKAPDVEVWVVEDGTPLGARRPLGGKQVRLPRRIWGEDEDLARRVRLPAAAESGGHDGAGGEPRGDHIHDRRRKLPAGKHRGGEEAAGRPAKQIRRRVDVLVPPAVEAADARRQALRRPRVTRLWLAFRAPLGATPPRGGAAGAVAGWLATDAIIIELDEALYRDDFERELVTLIDGQRDLAKVAALTKYETLLDAIAADQKAVFRTPAERFLSRSL